MYLFCLEANEILDKPLTISFISFCSQPTAFFSPTANINYPCQFHPLLFLSSDKKKIENLKIIRESHRYCVSDIQVNVMLNKVDSKGNMRRLKH